MDVAWDLFSIFGSLVVGPALWVVRASVRASRGRMTVDVAPSNPGAPVTGSVTISARAGLRPKALTVSVVGVEESWLTTHPAGEIEPVRIHKTKEIYRYEVTLDDSLELGRGEDRTLLFSVPTPDPTTGDCPPGAAHDRVERPRTGHDRRNRQTWTVRATHDGLAKRHEFTAVIPLRYELSGPPLEEDTKATRHPLTRLSG